MGEYCVGAVENQKWIQITNYKKEKSLSRTVFGAVITSREYVKFKR